MAAPRLPFLYPHLVKASRGWDPPSHFGALRRARDQRPPSLLAPRSAKRPQSSFGQQRYGQAAEPIPPQKKGDTPTQEPLPAPSPAEEIAKAKLADQPGEAPAPADAEASPAASTEPATDADTETDRLPRQPAESPSPAPAPEAAPAPENTSPSLALTTSEAPAGERVLHIDPRAGSAKSRSHPPHLEPPPYVHHFDTYTLVKGLAGGGFTQAQSTTLMKSVRSLLAVNMDLAREGLVSKSDVENELYLFRAAVSELRTEIQHSRQSAVRSQRSDLAHLQHDSDILAQKMTQELNTLKDELRGQFDERKMTVRTEQRRADATIEEINRRIQVNLLSDGKGRIEGLRWALSKRAVMAIVATAAVGLLFLRFITGAMHRKEERDRTAKGKGDGSSPLDDPGAAFLSRPVSGGAPGDSDAVLASAKGSGRDGVSYVTLG